MIASILSDHIEIAPGNIPLVRVAHPVERQVIRERHHLDAECPATAQEAGTSQLLGQRRAWYGKRERAIGAGSLEACQRRLEQRGAGICNLRV